MAFTINASGEEETQRLCVHVTNQKINSSGKLFPFRLTIPLLAACYQLDQASAAAWFIEGHAIRHHVKVMMHVHDP